MNTTKLQTWFPTSIYYVENLISEDTRFFLHHLNLDGISFALNYGLNLVKTKYMARMDCDDICHINRFEKQLIFLEKNHKYALVGSKVDLIDEDGKKLGQKFKFFENDKDIRRAIKYRMPLCHPAITFRTDVLLKHKGYLYGNSSEDHELFLRIARDPKNLFKNLPDNLFSYRKHENQLTDYKNARKSYYELGGFLFSEFLLTWNPLYLIGIIASHPFLRKLRYVIRKFKIS